MTAAPTSSAARGIGVKTAAACALFVAFIAIAAARGALGPTYLGHLSGAACLWIGAGASLATALLGVGWRFGARSKTGLEVARGKLRVIDGGNPRDLPGIVQRVLVLFGVAGLLLVALGNHAAARLTQLPDELAEPSPSQYCIPEPDAETAAEPAPAPPPPSVEPPGCALVKRAFQLGYAKSLGSCAPKVAAPIVAAPAAPREVCARRQLDEPFLHYGFRKVAEAFHATTAVSPITAARHRVDELRTRVTYLDGLLADVGHAVTGSPHASHHLWINLPDPHPGSFADYFVGELRCAERFAELPLWPAWRAGDEAVLVEHVLGQLLFATRFGTTASCGDYVIHWDAAPDTCARLARDPAAVLAADSALASVRAVLDRRRRQIDIGELARSLGRAPPDVPPPSTAVVSLACLIIDPAARAAATAPRASGSTVAIDLQAVGLRELRVPSVTLTGAGPIDVYAALAELLGGNAGGLAATTTAPEPVAPSGGDFLLTQLDPLIDGDPFRGARAPLDRAELVEVYPFEHHLHGFIDGFRRRYLAQRGRL